MSVKETSKHRYVFREDQRHKTRVTKRDVDYVPVRRRKTYRIRARDMKDRLAFFKTKTKDRIATIRRISTLKGLKPERITI